jgi:acetoacetyl-CoA reductase
MEIKLNNRIALVTGASGTIGPQICAYLHRAGARLAIGSAPDDEDHVRAVEKDLIESGAEVAVVPFDVAEFAAVGEGIHAVEDRLGPIDIVVNCAGITRDSTLKKLAPEDWDAVIRVNLYSVYNTSRHLAPRMAERGFGRIINIASVSGQMGQFGQANYAASKAGIHGFTMTLAREMASKGVTVNSVSPGFINSRMVNAIPEKARERIKSLIPMGRFGEAREVASVVTFLASDEASFITGANIAVNGGYHMSA